MRLNKSNVERIKATSKTQFHWDDAVQGFGVRTSPKGAKAFIVQSRVNGRSRRVTLGKFGVLTVDQARKRARETLVQMSAGIDPAAEKRKAAAQSETDKAKRVTLRQVWNEYRVSRTKRGRQRKKSTLDDINGHLQRNFADWIDRPITEITRDGVLKRHQQISKRGTYQADQAFRYLRALLNYGRDNHTAPDGTPVLPANPVDKLRAAGAWHAPERRRHVIQEKHLGNLIVALERLAFDPAELTTTNTTADLLLFLLFTGLRLNEAAQLKWIDTDLELGTITLADPKNRRPTTLPLSDEAVAILDRRDKAPDYVFAGRSNGYIQDTRGIRDRVADAAGGHFQNHDLRRTFATIADAQGIGGYRVKRLLNHAVSDADVTAGYISHETETLRQAANTVTSFMRERADIAGSDKVIHMGARA